MTSIDSLFSRGFLIITTLAIVLGIAGNLAPGVAAEAAGYALFGIVLAGPGIAIFTVRQAAKRVAPRPTRPTPLPRRVGVVIGLASLAIIGALAMPFAVVGTGKLIGEPGSEEYPDTATRVLLISIMGVPFIAAFALLLWQSLGPKKHYRRGMAKLAAGELVSALEHLEAYKLRRPNDPAGWEARAPTLVSLGRVEEGLAHASQALKLRRRWQGLLARGFVLFHLGATEEARQDLEESASLSRNPFVQASLGSVLVSLRRLDAAIAMLEDSRNRVRWMGASLALAEAYRLRGMTSQAESAYEEAAFIGRRAGHAGGTAVAAYSLAQLGRLDEAMEAASSVLNGEASRDLALTAIALISVRRADLATAEECLRELADRSPNLAVQALMDPDFSALLTNERFKRLLRSAMLARDEQVRRARQRLVGEE